MKIRLLAIAMLLCTFAAKAQYVTIPDPAFALFLQQTYPNCMNGNQMDTTCSEIVNEWYLSCSHANIADLEGVQYFDSLRSIDATSNKITILPQLPQYLEDLWCDYNQLSAISVGQLPSTLMYFTCDSNTLNSLPALPPSLISLSCATNNLSSLPALPTRLDYLKCSENPITFLPTLPDSLNYLNASWALLTDIPTLPEKLTHLDVSVNQISSIPNIPANIKYLNCTSNAIPSLPPLPNSLLHLKFGGNLFAAMPILPPNLIELDCSGNNISDLSGLPSSLEFLNCSSMPIPALPSMPPALLELRCDNNNLSVLPHIPTTLRSFICSNNDFTSFDSLPSSLDILICPNNPNTHIPSFPSMRTLACYNSPNLMAIGDLADSMATLNVRDCPNLMCLPKVVHVHNIFGFTNTGITCLPNYITAYYSNPNVDTMPVCAPNNPNGCASYADISGRTYADRNNSCLFDSLDEGQYGLKHLLYSNGILQAQTYSNTVGNYAFEVNAFGNYETRLDTTGLPFTIACPYGGVYYDTLTANDSTHFSRNFALQCGTGLDLAAQSVASAMIFRPANNTVVDIHAGDLANFYQASCIQGVSGTVTVTLHGPISYISPAANAVAPSNVTNNILTWNVADFGTADALHDFNIIIQTDTFAQSGQQACFDVNVTPLTGDNDTSNNQIYYCFDIVNSYDPNDKTAYPSGNIDTTQEWLTYRVRFQNTGTAEAQHIYIMDTLDANVKVETFQLLSYSHQPNVQIKENIVRFNFPFINLPDSTSNEPGSHGYVQYKVKLKDDLPIGTAINNTAYIYFDFNPPVVTNTATNTIALEEDTVVGIRSISKTFDLLVYPNPANQQVTIVSSEQNKTVTIYNMEGRMVLTHNIVGTAATLNIAQLPSGVYTIGINGTNLRKRLVKL